MKKSTIYLTETNLFCPQTGDGILNNGKMVPNKQVAGIWMSNNLSYPTLREGYWEAWNLFEIELYKAGRNELSFGVIKNEFIPAFNQAEHQDMMLLEVKVRNYTGIEGEDEYPTYCLVLINYGVSNLFTPPSIAYILQDERLISEEKVEIYLEEILSILEPEENDFTTNEEEEELNKIITERTLRKSDKDAYWEICMHSAAEKEEFEKALLYQQGRQLIQQAASRKKS